MNKVTKFKKGDRITYTEAGSTVYTVTGCGPKMVHFTDVIGTKHTAHVSSMEIACDDKYCDVHNPGAFLGNTKPENHHDTDLLNILENDLKHPQGSFRLSLRLEENNGNLRKAISSLQGV